jgi:hypothetical protein
MEDEGRDCLDLLEETPGTLRGLMRELLANDALESPKGYIVSGCWELNGDSGKKELACSVIDFPSLG